jgi:predicted nucleic acid-binding protein
VASLVDNNVLVYRHDPRDPEKQRIARELLRDPGFRGPLVVPHQALIEFVSVTTKPRWDLGGDALLTRAEALEEAESLMLQYRVLYPGREILLAAFRGASAYGLSWFDAHLWAYAEVNGIPEILSEDFEHGRHYGSVRAVDPFLSAAGEVHELPPMFEVDNA